MGEPTRHSSLVEDARRYGARLAERAIEHYGVGITDDQVEEIVADLTGQVLQQVRAMWETGMPARLTIVWGHECMNGVQDGILEHMEYLKVAAALVGFDPTTATKS